MYAKTNIDIYYDQKIEETGLKKGLERRFMKF